MGMYTELQGTVKFKTEELAKAFTESWLDVANLVEEVKPYVDYSRISWIPNSGEGVKFLQGTIVQFNSELKNYDSTIEKVLEILPLIAIDWILESRYEECSQWTLHRPQIEDVPVNGCNTDEQEWSWPKKIDIIQYPEFDVFDLGHLK